MSIFSLFDDICMSIGDALDDFNRFAKEYVGEDDSTKPLAKRDPVGLREGELEVLKHIQYADSKTRMEEILEFAYSIGNMRMVRKIRNRLATEAFEYEDILSDYGYTESDVDKYILS